MKCVLYILLLSPLVCFSKIQVFSTHHDRIEDLFGKTPICYVDTLNFVTHQINRQLRSVPSPTKADMEQLYHAHINELNEGVACLLLASHYHVKRIPSVVINGQVYPTASVDEAKRKSEGGL